MRCVRIPRGMQRMQILSSTLAAAALLPFMSRDSIRYSGVQQVESSPEGI